MTFHICKKKVFFNVFNTVLYIDFTDNSFGYLSKDKAVHYYYTKDKKYKKRIRNKSAIEDMIKNKYSISNSIHPYKFFNY